MMFFLKKLMCADGWCSFICGMYCWIYCGW